MKSPATTSIPGRDERGASLILAIVFVFAVGLALVAIGDFATGALRNTSNLEQLRSNEANAEAATTVALRYVQTSYTASIYAGTPTACLPVASVSSDVVWCDQTATPPTGYSRIVDFYTCPSGTSATNCVVGNAALLLHAQVSYTDWNFAGANNCSATTQATCGSGVTIDKWDVLRADS